MQDTKRRALIFVVLALVLSAFAGFLFMKQVSAVTGSLGKMTTVYVASKNIPSREPLKEEYFKPIDIPTKYVQDSAITDLNQIRLGKYQFQINQLTSVVPISKDGLLTSNMLKEQSFLTEKGKRMVSIARSNRIVFDGSFDFNDRVDLIVSTKGKNSPVTKTFMKDVLVVGVAKGKGGTINALGLEMDLSEAEKFIHVQNFAVSIRVLKAPSEQSSGKEDQSQTSEGSVKPLEVQPGQESNNTEGEQPPEADPSKAKPEDEVVNPDSP